MKKYKTIVVDPPWQVKAGPRSFHNRGQVSRSLNYATLSLEKISSLPIWDHAESDANIFLWTINKYIESSYSVIRAWGFKPSTMLVWCKKPKGRGMGGTFGISTEYVLFGTKGTPKNKRAFTTWFEAKRGKHSEKPQEFYNLVESTCDGEYLDVFSRNKRNGWDVWGNEVESDITL